MEFYKLESTFESIWKEYVQNISFYSFDNQWFSLRATRRLSIGKEQEKLIFPSFNPHSLKGRPPNYENRSARTPFRARVNMFDNFKTFVFDVDSSAKQKKAKLPHSSS
ncbi:MAG: hypothetical protein IPK35_22105 [Saprospiraceae bacterium]|nr:hypothetical protein [Saprospiraceae bacterium]